MPGVDAAPAYPACCGDDGSFKLALSGCLHTGVAVFTRADFMRVLLVEDDPMIGVSAQKGLRQDGFSVDWVRDAEAAAAALAANPFDAVLLDLGLPGKSGDEVLKSMRSTGNDIPVLIITARDKVQDRIAGLDSGADDYIVKPFDLDELAARIRAVQRRRMGRADPLIRVRDLTFDPAARRVTWRGEAVALSARELAQLEERIYGWGEEIESNAVEVYVHTLRRKLGADFIKTVRGVGYVVPRDP
jgi:two-component system, OmpR family, response regulator QseB